jgi:flagellar biosynthesis/type III secretory pathway M-ring protein FliF/YscJ
MDNALTPALLPAGARPGGDGVMTRLTAVPAKAMVMLTMGVAALAAVIAALAMWSKSGDYRVLYANLSDKDGGAILQQLSQMNVPYKHADGGSAILVPADKVHDARLRLAQAGLPKGSTTGFELLDNARFGQTQFQERMTWQRALEGELVRSITALAAVQNARVHLALPQQNGFFREQQKPSASVLVQLHPGRTLERAQIAGIVHLVSSSVPELSPKAVSVLDSSGTLLSGANDGAANGLDANQLQYVQQIEASYVKRVIDIIEPIVGRDNVVNYEVDKTVRVTRNATGIVKRLNAAVVVNHRVNTDAKGKTTSTPLTNDEVEKLTALVRESIGFNKDRGDSVKLINAPFRTEAMPKVEAQPLWQQPWLLDLVRAAAVPAALALVALLVVLGIIKPALKAAATTVGQKLDTVVADPLQPPTPTPTLALTAPHAEKALNEARALAKQNPAAVAHIVRDWVNNEA